MRLKIIFLFLLKLLNKIAKYYFYRYNIYMSKKQWIVYSAICAAIIAIIVGFYFVFLGNDIIEEVPSSLKVEKIDDDYYLVTEYGGKYGYQFKLEQMMSNEYVTVAVVDSDVNMINLNESGLDIIAGQNYRFSACFTTENGAGNGEFSQSLQWQPSWALDTVNYQSVSFDAENEMLTWGSVYLADSYVVKFVDANGQVVELSAESNSLSTQNIEVGKYKVYIFGQSSNSFLTQSYAGEGIDITITRKNVINSASRENGSLKIQSTEKVEKFEVYADGQLKGVLSVSSVESESGLYSYTFDNADFLFGQIDFEKSVVQIKSLACGCVLESDFVEIN